VKAIGEAHHITMSGAETNHGSCYQLTGIKALRLLWRGFRRYWLQSISMKSYYVFLLVLLPGFSSAKAETTPPKLNVLFIIADDQNTQLGCYGNSIVQTPHIDRLASRGIRFDRAYCQFPLCGPSRISFLTGLRPETTRARSNHSQFRLTHPDAVTLPQLFKANGYFTARVGKIFHQGVPDGIGTDGIDDQPSWNQVINPKGRDRTDESANKNFTPNSPSGSSLVVQKAQGDDTEQTDGMVATEAIKLLETHQHHPFFLAVGFYRPHLPLIAPKKYFDLYPLDKISLPQEPSKERDGKPRLAFKTDKIRDGLDETSSREIIQGYYASTSFMDAQLGRVLDALDKLKLAENTVVVFLGDHGFHLGEHGTWHKNSLYRESARVPLIISSPRLSKKGESCPRVIELVSLYPTLTELCELTPSTRLDGKSFMTLLTDPASSWGQPAFIQTRFPKVTGHSIRTEKWFYAEWNDDEAAELYDCENDPGEYINLVNDPIFKQRREDLSRELKAQLKAIREKAPPLTPEELRKKDKSP
jgi:iduronate 2-sulfatase